MKVIYGEAPVEGRKFHFSADEVVECAEFDVYLNGEHFWSHKCPDPPCHEQLQLPDKIAGSTLLIVARDLEEEHELTFFIGDDGRGVPVSPEIKAFAN